MMRQNERLKAQIKELRDKLGHHEAKEESLNKTLESLEKAKAESKQLAQREADLIRSEAKVEAEKILRQMEMRRQMLMEEIRSLETFYARLRSRLKVILDTFSDLIKTPEELREEIRLAPSGGAAAPPSGMPQAADEEG